MKLLTLFFCCAMPMQALAHYICSVETDTAASSSEMPSTFRVYLNPNGTASILGLPEALIGQWETDAQGNTIMALAGSNQTFWRASGTRRTFIERPRSYMLKLILESDAGQSATLACSSTELY